MEAVPKTIDIYKSAQEKMPFSEWLNGQTKAVRAIVDVRLKRVEKGLLGDHHAEGSGVWALIFDDGPGTRVYYGLAESQKVVLLLTGNLFFIILPPPPFFPSDFGLRIQPVRQV